MWTYTKFLQQLVAEVISTQSSMQSELIKQPELEVGIQVIPARKDMEVQTRRNMRRVNIQAKPTMMNARIEVKPKMKSIV